MILVDTSVWIDFLNSKRGTSGEELERLIRTNEPVVLTGVVVMEILQGLKQDVDLVTGLLARWPLVEPTGFATYEAAAGVYRMARGRGATLSTIDALIAVLALENDAALFSLDRDFERLTFTGLRLHGGKRR